MRKLLLILAALITGCSTTHPQRNPMGERFPTVAASDLNERPVTLPDAFVGGPVLVLVGYKQNTQFDIDRWLLALTQAKVDVKAIEVPTIPGMLPGLYANQIDKGMRSGIPSSLYDIVITVYGDEADKIAKFTGNANALPARALLLDRGGKVVFLHDEGFSVDALMKMQTAREALRQR